MTFRLVLTDRLLTLRLLRSGVLLLSGALLLAGAEVRGVFGADPAPSRLFPAAVDDQHAERAKKGLALFKKRVRRILIEKCVGCHGGKATRADFDLSSRSKLMDSGFVEQTARDSHLVALIEHRAEPHMPFQAERLPDDEIAAIRKWIDLGAPYDRPLVEGRGREPAEFEVTDADRNFWSFRPLAPVALPEVTDEDWCQSPVDRFIRSRQEAVGLTPNRLADPRILLRRIQFGLIGLPPTPEEVDAFAAAWRQDRRAAVQALIDRLLISTHYGERWARHWMDVARFAESHGYEQDYDRPHAYHYRDFLIRAHNADLPYDQFVRWQLAGDELAPDEPLALMATGFLGAGPFPTQLTEAEFESARYDELDDMVTTTGVAFLGLSIGCARCHDHKFDPISSLEYYRFASIFTRTIRSEIEVDVDPVASEQARRRHAVEVAGLRNALQRFEKEELPAKLINWLSRSEPAGQSGPWRRLHQPTADSTAGTVFRIQPDGDFLATGPVPDREVITITGTSELKQLQAVRLEALTHESLPHGGPGRASNGNFALGDIRVAWRPVRNGQPVGKPTVAKLVEARATHQQNSGTLSAAASIDDDPVSGWAVDGGGIGSDQAAVFDLAEPVTADGEIEVIVTLTLNHPNTKHTLGHFRVTVAGSGGLPPVVGQAGPPAEVLAAVDVLRRGLSGSSEKDAGSSGSGDSGIDRESPEWTTVLEWFRTQDSQWVQLHRKLEELRQRGPQLAVEKVMVSSEGLPHMKHHADGRGFPHFYPQTHVLLRGDPDQKLQAASPGFLKVLMPPDGRFADWRVRKPAGWERTGFDRAALASWITDTDSGAGSLAARVIVNRVWHHHFGRGIVSTPNDFGLSGERPTHPELLEWLAREFVRHGWSLKWLHRQILQSSVYQQSGDFDEARSAIDPENHLLWRRLPRRLEAEAIRDSLLAVSGQLDRTMFGPGTLDPDMKRRSVYFFIKRSQLIPSMMLFDWPEHLVSIGRRASTTIAPQALMFLNSPQTRANAQALAAQLPEDSLADAVTALWRKALGRVPQSSEREQAVSFVQSQRDVYAASDPQHARQRALTDLCQAVFGMNEFIYIE